jgi:hypothetical protein
MMVTCKNFVFSDFSFRRTSSYTDSDDSCRGKTSGVDNSFDSDSPSSHDSCYMMN